MCRALALDVTEPSQVKAAVAHAAATFGRIDVIVSNAGYGLVSALEELSDEYCISLGNMPMTSKRASLATRMSVGITVTVAQFLVRYSVPLQERSGCHRDSSTDCTPRPRSASLSMNSSGPARNQPRNKLVLQCKTTALQCIGEFHLVPKQAALNSDG